MALLMAWTGPVSPVWAHVNPDRQKAQVAHGIILGFAFAFLFPLGAILIRTASFRGLVVRQIAQLFLPVRDCFSSRHVASDGNADSGMC